MNQPSSSLNDLMQDLQKRFGTQALQQVHKNDTLINRLSTGISDLDDLLVGGLPSGKVTEITSTPTSGMTTLTLSILAQVQGSGGNGVYVDMAGIFDPDYALHCGVNPERLLVLQPPDIDEAGSMLRDVLARDAVTLCILNTIGANMRFWLERQKQSLVNMVAPTRSALLILTDYGNHSPLKESAYLRLHVKAQDWIFDDGVFVGYEAVVRVLKHQMQPTGGEITYTVYLGGTS